MTTWTSGELDSIGAAPELQITALGPDGTPRHPVPIWVVRHGDSLYVRSYRGAGGAWYRAATASRRAHVRAGGIDKDVTVTAVTNPAGNVQIDTAYRTKYGHHSAAYVGPMLAPQARATTLTLLPR